MKTVTKYAMVALLAVAIVAPVTILLINGLPGSGSQNNLDLTAVPTPTPNGNAVVTITYGKGATCPAGELYINVHIKNEGYGNFQPSGSKFVLTAGNVDYHYDFSGSKLLGWQNVDIANGERYDASIAFKVPDSTAPFVLSYDNTSTEYNIICQPE